MFTTTRGPSVAWRCLVAACFGACLAVRVSAVGAVDEATAVDPSERLAFHGQFTYVEQETDKFRAPYRGANSLSAGIGRETADVTFYFGARLWRGAQLWIDPEIDQGFGLDNTVGVAGFPSGEAYKVGRNEPYLRLPRAFIRQHIELGGPREQLESNLNQLAGSRTVDRLVLTVGKFSVTDIFDVNDYAHDPRVDFLNWAAVDAATFDYAADAWGYTVGAAMEAYRGQWAARIGLFDLSTVPNSEHLDPGFHEYQTDLELERRHDIGGRPGKVLITAFNSRGRMGLLDDAVRLAQQTGGPVSIAAVRRYRSRLGVDISLQQQILEGVGLFVRAGGAAGNVETYEFTDVDRALSAGLSVKGPRWGRPNDTAGFATIVNGISSNRRRFLHAGGLGILVGDGRLPDPGNEQILESYYDIAVLGSAHLTLDYQWVRNPAYNGDRGPASIFAVRVHAQL